VVGGLIVGTKLSLFEIPIMHTYVDDATRWLNRLFLRWEYCWPVAVEEEDDSDDPLTTGHRE
jgi:HAE1 family hydrophobic/amphiphilic exporter-1